jgi:phosphoglycerol transferase MdoB-like AlkP superfamily enzyme
VDGGDFKPDEITFSNAWGVCDGDLYRRVLKECDRSDAAGKPFLSVIMTTSNHRPFTHAHVDGIPDDTRKGARQYTDYAIGRLIAEARSKPWFDRTVFVILADHCAASAGKSDVTVGEYHIPLLIYAPKLFESRTVDALASQMDLAPTLLGLLNFSYTSKFFGRDVLEGGRGRAPLGNYEKVGLFADGMLELLLPMRKAQTFAVDDAGNQTEAPLDEALLHDTMAYYQSASYLLRNHLYTPE